MWRLCPHPISIVQNVGNPPVFSGDRPQQLTNIKIPIPATSTNQNLLCFFPPVRCCTPSQGVYDTESSAEPVPAEVEPRDADPPASGDDARFASDDTVETFKQEGSAEGVRNPSLPVAAEGPARTTAAAAAAALPEVDDGSSAGGTEEGVSEAGEAEATVERGGGDVDGLHEREAGEEAAEESVRERPMAGGFRAPP